MGRPRAQTIDIYQWNRRSVQARAAADAVGFGHLATIDQGWTLAGLRAGCRRAEATTGGNQAGLAQVSAMPGCVGELLRGMLLFNPNSYGAAKESIDARDRIGDRDPCRWVPKFGNGPCLSVVEISRGIAQVDCPFTRMGAIDHEPSRTSGAHRQAAAEAALLLDMEASSLGAGAGIARRQADAGNWSQGSSRHPPTPGTQIVALREHDERISEDE